MHFSYDLEANALYIGMTPTPRAAKTRFIDSGTLVDLDADGTVIGIEIINPLRQWPLDEICNQYGLAPEQRKLAEMFVSPKDETADSAALAVAFEMLATVTPTVAWHGDLPVCDALAARHATAAG